MAERNWKTIALAGIGVSVLLLLLTGGWLLYRRLLPGENIVKTASLTILRLERSSQLVTTRAYVQVVVRQRSEQWYGNAEIIRIVPATIHYAVNLAEIDRALMKYDEAKQVLHVPLPEVRVTAIDPDLSRAEIIRSLDLLRTQSGSGNPLEDSTEKMVRPELEKIGNSPAALKVAREQAVAAVRDLLEAAIAATGRKISVHPYFKNEGMAE